MTDKALISDYTYRTMASQRANSGDMAVVPKAMPHADEINQEAKDNALFIVDCVNSHAADKALISTIKRIAELYFEDWGAAKTAEWEDLVHDGNFSAETALKAILQKARAP